MTKAVQSKSMSFSVFLLDNRAKLSTRYPFLSQDQILSRLRQQWRQLSNPVLTKKPNNINRIKEKNYRSRSRSNYKSSEPQPSFSDDAYIELLDESNFQDEENEIDSPFTFVNEALRKLNSLSNWSKPQVAISTLGNANRITKGSGDNLKDTEREGALKLKKQNKNKDIKNNVNEENLKWKHQTHVFLFDDTKKARGHGILETKKSHEILEMGKSCGITIKKRSHKNARKRKSHKIKISNSQNLQQSRLHAHFLTSSKEVEKNQCTNQADAYIVKNKADNFVSKSKPILQKNGTPVRFSKRLAINKSFGDLDNSNFKEGVETARYKKIQHKHKKSLSPLKDDCSNEDNHQLMRERGEIYTFATSLKTIYNKKAKNPQNCLISGSVIHKKLDARLIPSKQLYSQINELPQSKISHAVKKLAKSVDKLNGISMNNIQPKKKDKLFKEVQDKRLSYDAGSQAGDFVLPKKPMRQCQHKIYDNSDIGTSGSDMSGNWMFEEKNFKCATFTTEDPEVEAALPKFDEVQLFSGDVTREEERKNQEKLSSQDFERISEKESEWDKSVFNKPLGILFQDPSNEKIACANTPGKRRLVRSAPSATPSNFHSMFDTDPFDAFF